jgi:hypothetical protein
MKTKRFAVMLMSGCALALPATAKAQTVQSQDSILANTAVNYGGAQGFAMSGHDAIIAAESTISLSAGFMHTQYHENATPGTGDDESGFTYGLGAGISGLIPNPIIRADLYTALQYDFDAGNITYGGHYLYSGLPAEATDNAVFNRLEARFGVGFPVGDDVELIPFVAGGYQAWNRNVNQKDEIGSDEFYRAGLMGGGLKLDIAASPRLVFSATGEALAVVGGGTRSNDLGLNFEFGPTGEERFEIGADYAVTRPFHVFTRLDWEHFNYSGSKLSAATLDIGGFGYKFYEPLSTTTQFGANVGVAYSFY